MLPNPYGFLPPFLNPFVGDTGTGGQEGLVPAPPAGSSATNSFLSAIGTWQPVASSYRPVSNVIAFVNTNTVLTSITTVLNSAGATITLSNGQNVCLSNQTTALQNSRYTFNSGNLTLASDCLTGSNQQNTIFFETSTGNQYGLTSENPVIVGTNVLIFKLFSQNQTYFADETTLHLNNTNNTFSIFPITQGSSGTSFLKININAYGQVVDNSAVASTDIISALGYTPYNATNPSNYIAFASSLTGLAITGGAITSASTILGAFGALQNQINGLAPAGSYITSLTTDIVAVGPGAAVATIQPNVVNYAKMQQVSGANKLLGNPTGSASNVEEIGISSIFSFNAGNLILANISNNKLLGNFSGSTASPIAVGITANLINTGGALDTAQGIQTTSSPTFVKTFLTSNTNQIVLGTTNTQTITSATLSASYVFTLPAANSNPSTTSSFTLSFTKGNAICASCPPNIPPTFTFG